MQKWEIQQVFIRMEMMDGAGPLELSWIVPRWGEVAVDNWAQAEHLAREGWELVSSVPIIASTGDTAATCTWGYVLLFKRPVES